MAKRHRNASKNIDAGRYNKKEECCKRGSGAGILVPAGLFIGLGLGLLYQGSNETNVAVGMFVGLGLGFLAFAIIKLLRK